jgi:hypothetical protein
MAFARFYTLMELMVAASTTSEFSKDTAIKFFNESFGRRRHLLPAADYNKIDSEWNDFLISRFGRTMLNLTVYAVLSLISTIIE